MTDNAPDECHHDDVFQGVCVWCRAEVGTGPTGAQARIVGDLLGPVRGSTQ